MTSDGPALGLRERKKTETRAALRAAAIRLYTERGPSAVTVHDICEAADVSLRTFFNYFDCKEEVLFAWDRQLTRELIARFAQRPPHEPPLAALRRVIDDTLPDLDDVDWRTRNTVLSTHPELAVKAAQGTLRLEDMLVQALAERFGRPVGDLYSRLLAGAAMSALRAAFRSWPPQTGAAGLRSLIAEAFDALAAGLPGPGGR
jgi:AcrR family transcriptional regulator